MANYITIFLCGVFISSCAQILLKKSACAEHNAYWQEYFNFKVITAYILFFVSSLLTLIAYKKLPLSTGVVLEASGYVFIALLSWKLLKEKIGKRKVLGLGIIMVGIIMVGV